MADPARTLGLHVISRGKMGLLPYGAVMLVRLILELAMLCAFGLLIASTRNRRHARRAAALDGGPASPGRA
jgi:hypothetical protein